MVRAEAAVFCAVGTILVRLGLTLYQCGMARSKNTAGVMVRALADASVATLAFWGVGAAIAASDATNGILGLTFANLFANWDAAGAAGILILLAATLLASAVVTGAVAERSRFFPQLAVPALLAALVVPLAAYWVWNPHGWLGFLHLGFIDAAGATVIHLVGGLTAAVAVVFVGPRQGKYNRDGSANAIPGHSVPLASTGLLVAAAAWIPYVAGLGRGGDPAAAALNVLIALAAGGLASFILGQLRYGKPDVYLAYAGALGALVAVSAGGGLIGARSAFLIGAVAGALVPLLAVTLDLFWKLDDPTSAVAIHAGGGAIGTLLVGILAPTGSFADRLKAFGVQLLGLSAIAALTLAAAIALFLALRAATPLRSKEADEYDGLDLAEHDIGAYPDFQQTMIKSYHLREA